MLETGNNRPPKTASAALANGPERIDGDLVGYVVRLDAYALPAFGGCCALLALHNSPTNDIVAVLTRDPRIQSVFETALATNKLIAVFGTQLYQQTNPQGERWADVVYNTYRVVLHNVA